MHYYNFDCIHDCSFLPVHSEPAWLGRTFLSFGTSSVKGSSRDGTVRQPSLLQPHKSCMSASVFQSHLSVLESSARLYPTRPAFRIPVVNKETSQVSEWAIITYTQFHHDVELYARYWSSVLSAAGIALGSVVGFWYVSYLALVSGLRLLTPRSKA